jgi:hypothetical protein
MRRWLGMLVVVAACGASHPGHPAAVTCADSVAARAAGAYDRDPWGSPALVHAYDTYAQTCFQACGREEPGACVETYALTAAASDPHTGISMLDTMCTIYGDADACAWNEAHRSQIAAQAQAEQAVAAQDQAKADAELRAAEAWAKVDAFVATKSAAAAKQGFGLESDTLYSLENGGLMFDITLESEKTYLLIIAGTATTTFTASVQGPIPTTMLAPVTADGVFATWLQPRLHQLQSSSGTISIADDHGDRGEIRVLIFKK